MGIKISMLALILALQGCSSLTTEQNVLAGTLAYGAVSTASDGKLQNYGTTHALTSYGLITSVEVFADSMFDEPDQEIWADLTVTAMALGSAAYWIDRENLVTVDSKADVAMPTGVSLWKIWERWTEVQ